MARKSLRPAIVVLIIALACAVAVPPQAHASPFATSSEGSPLVKLWSSALDWLHRVWWPGPSTSPSGSPWYKFGAGHTSDGHTVTKSSLGMN